jgi:hypothetical protein
MSDTATAKRVMCGNDHPQPTPAVVHLHWPGGRFEATTACEECLGLLLDLYVLRGPDLIEGPYPVNITPVPVPGDDDSTQEG